MPHSRKLWPFKGKFLSWIKKYIRNNENLFNNAGELFFGNWRKFKSWRDLLPLFLINLYKLGEFLEILVCRGYVRSCDFPPQSWKEIFESLKNLLMFLMKQSNFFPFLGSSFINLYMWCCKITWESVHLCNTLLSIYNLTINLSACGYC